jgi:hypothetical protein
MWSLTPDIEEGIAKAKGLSSIQRRCTIISAFLLWSSVQNEDPK